MAEPQDNNWPRRVPYVPDGWIAIPKSALLCLSGQAAASDMERAVLRDPDKYREYRIRHMFQDMAIDLAARHEPYLKTIDLGHGVTATRADVTLIDPDYVDFRQRMQQERRVAEQPENVALAMKPTAATPTNGERKTDEG